MGGDQLHIGMVAPISHGFPPDGYGPWERVCHDLTEGLVELGHEVTVFAPAGSITSATLHETVPSFLTDPADHTGPPDARVVEELHVAVAMSESVRLGVDVVHSHLHVHALGYAPLLPMPLLTTLHGAAWDRNNHIVLNRFRDHPFVSLSHAERAFLPELNYIATVGNGIRLADFAPGGRGSDRLVFVGRIAPEKAPDLAIAVAKSADRPIVLAGGLEPKHQSFFDERIRPHLRSKRIEYVGWLSRTEMTDLVREAAALVMPLRWDEPFGLVVIESLALGTPVIAWRRGAMSELVDHGVTGFLVDDVAAAAESVDGLGGLDREECRRRAVAYFGHLRMAEGYVAAYRQVLAG